jgi:adenylate cyclase
LRTLFTAFDVIFKNYDCIRIKTIGDAYLGVSGIPDENTGGKINALNAINACREIRDYIDQRNATMTSEKDMWSVRIGVATGAVVGAILSEDNCLFDIFGDTVNLASRVQHLGNPNEIWSCEKTAALVKDAVGVESMGMHDVKGKGVLHIYRIAESDRHTASGEAKPKVKIVTKYKL